jgi:hypothetical protein
MKLKFFNPNNLDKNLKATAHKTGKLGFTVDAAKKLQLSVEKTAGIGINEDDELDKSLYVIIYPDKQEGAFNISKAGKYYYINTKALFDSLRIDYIKDYVVYDISEEMIDSQRVFKFKRREKAKKNNDSV